MSRPLSPLSYRPREGPVYRTYRRGLPATATAAAVTTTAASAAATSTIVAVAAIATVSVSTAVGRTSPGAGARLGLEAVAAVDGAVAAGLKGDASLVAARCARNGEHFAIGPGGATTARFAFAGAAATYATTRLVREALRSMELLLTRSECETRPAVDAGQFFVGVRHPTTSLKNCESQRSSSACANCLTREADGT